MQVMETRKKIFNDEYLDTLIIIINLISTYNNRNWWKKAEKLEMQIIKTRKKMLDDEHFFILIIIINLASTYRN